MKHSIFIGFSLWKHSFIKSFLPKDVKPLFLNPWFSKNTFALVRKKGLDESEGLYIWGKKSFEDVEQYAVQKNIPIYRVEDGFIRSVGLGSDLTRPYSLVIDNRGIYFDPTQESDLEYLLNYHTFSETQLLRAKKLCKYLIKNRLSKYNNYADVQLDFPSNKKIVLVPGQVEDDASIRLGAPGMTNLKLLQMARENAPDAYIVFKPHPDVLSKNRVGDVAESEALKYCDHVINEVSLDSMLSICDEVHTMTSLVGFEALMRGIRVYTYGLPFYAGWGLTVDKKLVLDEIESLHLVNLLQVLIYSILDILTL